MHTDKAEPMVGIVATALSALLVLGMLTFAGPCAHEDGSAGTCLWAQRAVLGVGAVLLALSLVRIFERDEGERRGLSLSIALLGILAACIPGTLIALCAEQGMRCTTAMQPFALAVGVALAVVGATDLVMRLRAIIKRP